MLFERRLAAITLMVWVGCVGCQVDDEIEPDDVGGGSDGGADAMPSCDEDAVEPCFVEGECRGERSCVDGAWTACQGLPELCDGDDNDCDGLTDEGFAGLGDPCEAGDGRCLDRGRMVCADDGAGVVCDATPGDGSDEVCDGIDNDCDGSLDEEVAVDETCDTRQLGVCSSGLTACVDGDTVCAPSATPSDEICDGLDNDCDGRADEDGLGGLLAEPCYEGPDGTEGVGACAAGVSRCVDGMFGACVEQVVPGGEICDGVDNDCDGVVDIGECDCVPGETRACYGGPDGTEGVGACGAGTQTCLEDGTYGACVGQVVPGVEACDGIDNDCDGEIDDAPGVGQPCAAGLGACLDQGTRVCDLESGQVICDAVAGLPADEICDGVDNDCDGAIDDVDGVGDGCSIGEGACLGRGVLRCDGDALACDAVEGAPSDETCNFVDDDCDGVIDEVPGLDEACDVGVGLCRSTARTRCDFQTGAVFCPATAQDPAPFEDCRNRVDDDCDGAVDEADCLTRCRVDDDCPDPLGCVDGICEVVEICGNRLDDDGDGDIDCADADCADLPACLVELDCADGFDDDADGDTDCADADCAAESVCLPEMDCFDRMDNDVDGDTDCDDADCAADPVCLPETLCNDGLDSDRDGDIDCDDADCAADPVCLPEGNCNDGLDDDLDGDIDCADADCAADPVCLPEGNCADGLDDDLDGDLDCDDADCAADPACVPEGSLRLVDGDGPESGRLEVYHAGEWGTVCDDVWEFSNSTQAEGFTNGDVACRQLGFVGAVTTFDAPPGQGPIWMDQVRCVGDEGQLIDCPFDGFGVNDCEHDEDIGLTCLTDGACRIDAHCPEGRVCVEGACVDAEICDNGEDDDGDGAIDCVDPDCFEDAGCPEGELRLVGGDGPESGRLEVFHAGEWGTVCDDNWEQPDGSVGPVGFANGDVACRQLGFVGVAAVFNGAPGADPIWMDGVTCTGEEGRLVDCAFNGFGLDDCGHGEDISLTCLDEGECRIDEHCPDGQICADGLCGEPVEICEGGVDDDGDGAIDCEDADCEGDPVCEPPLSCPDADDRFEDTSDNLPGARVEPGLIEDLILCDADNYDFLLCDGGSVVVTVLFSHAEGDITALLGHRERGVLVSQGRSGDDDEVLEYTNSSGAQATMDIIVQNNTESIYAIDLVIEGCGAPEPEPEICEGGVDEDGDGATDCDDDDCEGDPACVPFEPVIFFTVPDLDGGTTTLAGVDADGAVRSIGDITGGGDPLLVSALAMSPAGELVGFVPDGDSSIVVVIDATTAEATPYGGGDPTTIPIVVWGAAFGPDGTLFLVGSDNILYGISPVLDGITIVAAPLQLPFEISDGDIAFDADGNCYFDAIDPEDNDLGLFACDFVAGTVEPIPAVSEGFDAPLGASGLAFGAGDDICLGSLYAIDAGGVEEVGRYDFTVDPPLLSVFGSLGADVVPVGLVDAAGFFARPDLPECAVEICDSGVDDDGDGDVDCDDDDCVDDLVCQAPPLSCPDVDDRFEDASDNLPGARVEPGLIEDLILCDADNYDFLLCDGGSVVVTVLFSHAEGDITALLGHRERGVVVSQGRSGDDDEVLSYTNSSGAQATMDVIVQNNTESLYAIDIVIEGCDP